MNNSTNPLIKEKISNIDDITKIYEENKDKNKKLFYSCREEIHKILHDSQIFFYFDENQDLTDIKEDLPISELFYLSLLVLNNAELDFIYSFNYIILIYNYLKQNVNNNEQYKKIIISKILDCIIENYKDIEEYEYECEYTHKKELKEIESFIQANLNDYGRKKIDAIYLDIIISLIKNHEFDNYDSCYDIIKQLDLENIDITPMIFEGLSKTLNNKAEYMDYYIINYKDDLMNETKINFYYIIIKFILKQYDLNNIEFLNENIKQFKKILEDENGSFVISHKSPQNFKPLLNILNIENSTYNYDNSKNNQYSISISNNESLEKNIKNGNNDFTDNSSSNLDNNKNLYSSSVFNNASLEKYMRNGNRDFTHDSSSNLDNSEHKEYRNILDSKIEPKKAKKILEKFQFKIIISRDKEEINVKFYDITYGKDDERIDDIDNLGKNMEIKNKNDEIIYNNYKKLLFFLEEIEDYIKKSDIKIKKCDLEFLLNLEGINNDIYNILCTIKFNNIFDNKEYQFKDENILVNSIDSKSKGFLYLINELTNDDYSNYNIYSKIELGI